MARSPRGVNAWLLTWHPMSDKAKAEVPNLIAGILPGRTPDKILVLVMETLYANHAAWHFGAENVYPGDQLSNVTRRGGYRATRHAWPVFTCGGNPVLQAEKVERLRTVEADDGSELLTWDELRFPVFRKDVDPAVQLEHMTVGRRAMKYDPRRNTIEPDGRRVPPSR